MPRGGAEMARSDVGPVLVVYRCPCGAEMQAFLDARIRCKCGAWMRCDAIEARARRENARARAVMRETAAI